MKRLVETLLANWCNGILSHQLNSPKDSSLHGAIYCDACGCIHGRCFEAMFPFLCMAKKTADKKWIKAAQRLFLWAEKNLSQPDGSYVNDICCDWKGTTVFNTIQLADCIIHHNDIISEKFKKAILRRIKKAASFLYSNNEINDNNINYPISNALALYECSVVLNNPKYARKAARLALLARDVVTTNGLILGEGLPRFEKSARGCNAVDIGYNVEETLPSLALYGLLSGNVQAQDIAEKSLLAHLDFMAANGAWDNSFGTRSFKWAYWGSRTSDGCALGYLLFARKHAKFAIAAQKNIELMQKCTIEGLLAAGPHYVHAKQLPCVHHTFTHAKVLAAILDRKLCYEHGQAAEQPCSQSNCTKFYSEIDTYKINNKAMSATITCNDWKYINGGHVSGGTLSFLHHSSADTILCASTTDYFLHEPHNMQTPFNVLHECTALRIENKTDNLYSSVYETNAKLTVDGDAVIATGNLTSITGEQSTQHSMPYIMKCQLKENALFVRAEFAIGTLICPIISSSQEKIIVNSNKKELTIIKNNSSLHFVSSSAIELPYNNTRIFNLAPGLQALRINIPPCNGVVEFTISIIENL